MSTANHPPVSLDRAKFASSLRKKSFVHGFAAISLAASFCVYHFRSFYIWVSSTEALNLLSAAASWQKFQCLAKQKGHQGICMHLRSHRIVARRICLKYTLRQRRPQDVRTFLRLSWWHAWYPWHWEKYGARASPKVAWTKSLPEFWRLEKETENQTRDPFYMPTDCTVDHRDLKKFHNYISSRASRDVYLPRDEMNSTMDMGYRLLSDETQSKPRQLLHHATSSCHIISHHSSPQWFTMHVSNCFNTLSYII